LPKWLFRWLVNTLALLLAAAVFKGVEIDGVVAGIVAAGILGLVNVSIRPVLIILTLPVNLLTLGLFTLVINALMLQLVAWLVPGFSVDGFGAGLAAAIISGASSAKAGEWTSSCAACIELISCRSRSTISSRTRRCR